MRNGLLKVLILLDDTGIRELNDGKSVEGKSEILCIGVLPFTHTHAPEEATVFSPVSSGFFCFYNPKPLTFL